MLATMGLQFRNIIVVVMIGVSDIGPPLEIFMGVIVTLLALEDTPPCKIAMPTFAPLCTKLMKIIFSFRNILNPL